MCEERSVQGSSNNGILKEAKGGGRSASHPGKNIHTVYAVLNDSLVTGLLKE